MTRTKKLSPITPGEVLAEDFMAPLGLSAHRLALALRVPATRISGIVNGRRAISADTALRLARFFNTSATLWMNLQTNYELRKCDESNRADVERDVIPMAAVSLIRIKRSAKRPTCAP
jgi:addiction module HigA family antidote